MRILFIYLFLFSLCSLSAQYSISGHIVNDAGEPLIQASVFVVESQYATITDENGYYELKDLEEGDHTLKASFVGYQSFETYVYLEGDRTIDINLGNNDLYLEAVSISANRLKENSPFVSLLLDREQINKENLGQDIPHLLRWTPSTVVTSDAGNGIGYTGIRIRGSDATRVNVTLNGVPLNDAESQGVFWVDLPDFASSVDDIQIVRGVGTSTNGAGAFGGTVSLNTDKVYQNNYIRANGSIGSFGTRKTTFSIGTGIINNKYVIDGRYSTIKSDGFVDRGSADLSSYYIGIGRVTDKSSLKFITFSGSERTYQAWNGVPEAKALGDEAGSLAHFNWNKEYLYPTVQDSINYFESNDQSYNYYTYDNQVDDYTQTHYQLHHVLSASEKLTFKTSAYVTKGKGYFEQFRYKDDYEFYGIPAVNASGDSIATADTLIRRKWLDNTLFGGIFIAKYNLNEGNIQLGLAASRYDGLHFGRVIYAQGFSSSAVNRRYYENNGIKNDLSAYIKYNQDFGKLSLFVDGQYRQVDYTITGINDDKNPIEVDRKFNFFNPKIGMSYLFNKNNNVYLSAAVANREPDRNDVLNITNSENAAAPERLTDIELGYRYNSNIWTIEWNNYLMKYKDQLVLTGALDDVGNSMRTNVADSYRLGTEISISRPIFKNLYLNINSTLSNNKIREFEESIGELVINHQDTDIAFSPSVIAASSFLYKPNKKLGIELSTKYVGDQFLDNTSNENRKIDAFTYTNIRASYSWDTNFLDKIKFTLLVNNVLNSKYSSNGYTYSYDIGTSLPDIITENYLYPQAGIHFLFGVEVSL